MIFVDVSLMLKHYCCIWYLIEAEHKPIRGMHSTRYFKQTKLCSLSGFRVHSFMLKEDVKVKLDWKGL